MNKTPILKTSYVKLPLHSGHSVQLHVITSTKAFCKRIVLNLQLGYLKHEKHLIGNILCNKSPTVHWLCHFITGSSTMLYI